MFTNEPFLIKDFKRLIANNGLGHAYLFFGESEIARREVGLAILKLLESDHKDQQDFLRDGFMIEPDASGSIGIGIIRDAINFLWQRPVASPRRTLFIDGADCLTPEAANALLKTVEEPPAHGLVIASILSPESLIAPLSSRFQKIFISFDSSISEANSKDAEKFIKGTAAMRKLMISQVLEAESHSVLMNFVQALLVECQKDPVKHFE